MTRLPIIPGVLVLLLLVGNCASALATDRPATENTRLPGLFQDTHGGPIAPPAGTIAGLCTHEVTPQIFAGPIVSTPDPGDILARPAANPSVFYIVGTTFDVTVTVPRCVTVARVSYNDRGIPALAEVDPIDGSGDWYEIVTTRNLPEDKVELGIRYTTRLRNGLGGSAVFRIAFKSIIGAGARTADVSFTTVDVLEVNSPGEIGLSLTQLENLFILSLWDQFGPDNRTDEGAYDPNYNPGLWLESDGVHLDWPGAKFAIENWCDFEASVKGRFHLEVADPNSGHRGLVVWDAGPDADLSTPWYCDVPANSFGGLGYWMAQAMAADDLETAIAGNLQQQVDKFLQSAAADANLDCGGLAYTCRFLYRERELVAQVDLTPLARTQTGSVTIAVPYNIDGLPSRFDPTEQKIAVAPTDSVVILASGVVSTAETENQYEHHGTGPWGLENEPTHLADLDMAIDSQARIWLHWTRRSLEFLPVPGGRTGSLIYSVDTPTHDGVPVECGPVCFVPSPPAGSTLSLGINDYPVHGNDFGSGQYRVTLIFQPEGV